MCLIYNLTLFYSVSLIFLGGAATAFDIFGTDNTDELLTCGFQYPSLPISILHFVARIFGRTWYNFALFNAGESGKHQNLQAFFATVPTNYAYGEEREQQQTHYYRASAPMKVRSVLLVWKIMRPVFVWWGITTGTPIFGKTPCQNMKPSPVVSSHQQGLPFLAKFHVRTWTLPVQYRR